MYMCLGQEDEADLCTPLRASEADERLKQAILEGIARKPKGHDFVIIVDQLNPGAFTSLTQACPQSPGTDYLFGE
jgi:cyclic pyranopterin phosphate synthase